MYTANLHHKGIWLVMFDVFKRNCDRAQGQHELRTEDSWLLQMNHVATVPALFFLRKCVNKVPVFVSLHARQACQLC